MSPGVIGNQPGPATGATNTRLPVQSYLVTTPLNYPGAALISLTLRFDQSLHNLIPNVLATTLDQGLDGWAREPLASGNELLKFLATLDTGINGRLRAAIIEALDYRAAVLRFSDPRPFRLVDLERLATGIAAFSKTPMRDLRVGVLRVSACLIILSVVVGTSIALEGLAQRLVTEVGNPLIDRVGHNVPSGLR